MYIAFFGEKVEVIKRCAGFSTLGDNKIALYFIWILSTRTKEGITKNFRAEKEFQLQLKSGHSTPDCGV